MAHISVGLELQHDPVKAKLRDVLHKVRIQLARVKIFTRNQPDLRKSIEGGSICRRWWISFQELREKREILFRVQPVHLIADRRLHIDGRVYLAFGRRVWLPVGAQRYQLAL